jgi:hypothetical protein
MQEIYCPGNVLLQLLNSALLAFRDVLRTRHLNLIARIIDDDFFSNPFRDVVLIQREIPRD